MDITKSINALNEFYFEVKNDGNGRYRSWEHCYFEFYKARNQTLNNELLDHLCLHLAFYLASWGMYRGSSFLLQKDYKVHKKAVEELMKRKYNPLLGISCVKLIDKKNQLVLQTLIDALRKIYNDIRINVKGSNLKNAISDTLITKILMGTLGCVPAYDRYFIDGIRKQGVSTGTFNFRSLEQLVEFYSSNKQIFENERKKMKIEELDYPQMKIIDMIFWQIGYDSDLNK